MPNQNPQVGDVERVTQNRVVKFFQDVLDYEYLGNWEKYRENSNLEEAYLLKFLTEKQGHEEIIAKKAIAELEKVATDQQKSLYDINKEVYSLLRYGTEVVENPGSPSEHVHFIDWKNPQNNHFAIAEEVTIHGKHTKRPDIVIYVNGIALGVLELKRSKVSISKGIRQNLDNQKREFIHQFFATQQLVMAGNDTQGLSYGTIETPERYYLQWKEENPEYEHNKKTTAARTLSREKCNDSENMLDCDIYNLLNKKRFLELIYNFVVFDAGIKKLARHNQYFGVKKTQERIKQREGGIIWHSQGSGKSLTMVWLAKWVKENIDNSRVLIITDRKELDEQIETTFRGVGEENYKRATSGSDLLSILNKSEDSLVGSLIHKFGRGEDMDSDKDYDEFIAEIRENLPSNFEAKGDLYVFVDECHRTNSGKLHGAMKEILPNAFFVGFTGTPLLKKDKKTTIETFGNFIHTYKFDEAVEDRVILDLRYEARDVDLKIVESDKIDKWVESKTKGLSDVAQAELKRRWSTMQTLVSSRSRIEKIVREIMFDFGVKPRLESGRGNAMLVAGSIYEACKYYEIFVANGFTKCAVVTSYTPQVSSITGEGDSEEQMSENVKKYEVYKKMIAGYLGISEDEAEKDDNIKNFEKKVKKQFKKEPAQMKLLIVVDKLLTGFDAPSATYLYVDKKMQDHGLFQAICRVNRLDEGDQGDDLDKEFGYIIDYKDLFNSIENAVDVYTSGAFEEYDSNDVTGLLKDRLTEGKERLNAALEYLKELTEGIEMPRGTNEYRAYFVGDDQKAREQLRLSFYKAVSSLVRAYTNIANELDEAGYSTGEQKEIKREVTAFASARDEVKLMSSDYLDLKRFNPAMRHLIDSYVEAGESKKISALEDMSLLQIIIEKGLKQALAELPTAIGSNKEAVAETIENNIRKLITDERAVNPEYYEKMSVILEELARKRKEEAIAYEEYLKKIEELAKDLLGSNENDEDIPSAIKVSKARRALYDNLGGDEELAVKIDEGVKRVKHDGWRSNRIKSRKVRNELRKILQNKELVNKIFDIVLEQDEY